MSKNPKLLKKEPSPSAPSDLRKALSAARAADVAWKDLTPIARRDFIGWIDSAKQAQTRKRRVERACSMLAAGKRRPCCYSIVPMNLYKALSADPKAKAQWKILSPDERRDLVGWIESAKESEARKLRIEEACTALKTGKKRP